MDVPGRNDPCPCGSGLKFKRCHGGPDAPESQVVRFPGDARPAEGPIADVLGLVEREEGFRRFMDDAFAFHGLRREDMRRFLRLYLGPGGMRPWHLFVHRRLAEEAGALAEPIADVLVEALEMVDAAPLHPSKATCIAYHVGWAWRNAQLPPRLQPSTDVHTGGDRMVASAWPLRDPLPAPADVPVVQPEELGQYANRGLFLRVSHDIQGDTVRQFSLNHETKQPEAGLSCIPLVQPWLDLWRYAHLPGWSYVISGTVVGKDSGHGNPLVRGIEVLARLADDAWIRVPPPRIDRFALWWNLYIPRRAQAAAAAPDAG